MTRLDWACPRCGTANDAGFELCARCGARPDGTVNPALAEAAGVRTLDCLRCAAPMTRRGTRAFHEGSQAAPFLLGGLGELLVNRETFEVYACAACGKVELFLEARSADA